MSGGDVVSGSRCRTVECGLVGVGFGLVGEED